VIGHIRRVIEISHEPGEAKPLCGRETAQAAPVFGTTTGFSGSPPFPGSVDHEADSASGLRASTPPHVPILCRPECVTRPVRGVDLSSVLIIPEEAPVSNDVVELILADHRRFEDLFRRLRSAESDRKQALDDLAHLLVAHAEAEETEVYPVLRTFGQVDEKEVDHGSEEHTEGHEALLALLEVAEPGADGWDDGLEELVHSINHHLDEEERTILNQVREVVSTERREELGQAFVRARQARLNEGCGGIEYVRELVRRSKS
jgi:hemerythrin superfamily protein